MPTTDALTLLVSVRNELQDVQSALVDQHLAARDAGDAERERMTHDIRSQMQKVLGTVDELHSELEALLGRAP